MFSDIRVKEIKGTPAAVNIATGVLYINPKEFDKLKPEHKFFVLCHEWAHYAHQTKDEVQADAIAFNLYASMGYPLSEAVKAITQVLPFTCEEHLTRAKSLVQRAIIFDQINNTGKKTQTKQERAMNASQEYLQKVAMLTALLESGQVEKAYTLASYLKDAAVEPAAAEYFKSVMTDLEALARFDGFSDEEAYELPESNYAGDMYPFFGLGKEAKEARKQKDAIRLIKTQAKAEATVKRANAKEIRANAKQTLADQGISSSPNFGSIIDKAAGVVGKVAGAATGLGAVGAAVGAVSEPSYASAPVENVANTNKEPEPEKKGVDTWVWIAAGAGALVVIGVIVWLVMRKK